MTEPSVRAIVTDIEGTTSALSFVKHVLFPYARQRLPAFVHEHAHEPTVRAILDDARHEAPDTSGDQELVDRLLRWIDEDRKITALKALQGLIWEQGYRDGSLVGHVYPDAARHLRDWRARGIRLYVFSSGSVLAQKLLFAHTGEGDLTPLFTGYFDTTIGAKREPESYRAIAREIGLPATGILFLSDIEAELDAAAEAGMRTTLLARDGGPAQSRHPITVDFDGVEV